MTVDRMSSLLQTCLVEVMGETNTGWVDSLPDNSSSLLAVSRQRITAIHGLNGAAGILWRVGRAFFREYLLQLEDNREILRSDQRFLPFRRKVESGLAILAESFSGIGSQQIHAASEDGMLFWRIESCLDCMGRIDDSGICSFYLGLVQEYLSWTGGGKAFLVEEMECKSRGAAACILRIDPRPVE
jgi:predicted hydrocarbon binding protein